MTQIIVGAGMAGLLAARMLAHREPLIIEAQPSLPNNHSAVLRFRTPTVGEVLGIPFRRVEVIKGVEPWRNPIADALAYSAKTNGKYLTNRSMPGGVERASRWIAPPDLVERMARGVDVRYNQTYDWLTEADGKAISTIPMPHLLQALECPLATPDFSYIGGTNVVAQVRDCDAYATLYFPDPSVPFSRVTITGSELIIETVGDEELLPEDGMVLSRTAASKLGLPQHKVEAVAIKRQAYAKIAPIDDHVRKSLIFWASSLTGRAFSLGRFATWRPGLLMDDLINDVRLIDQWIESPTAGYSMDLHNGRKG